MFTAKTMQNASIGVMSTNKGIARCGTWPDVIHHNKTLRFECAHAGPARSVRVWKDGSTKFAMVEVEATGIKLLHDSGMFKHISLTGKIVAISQKAQTIFDK